MKKINKEGEYLLLIFSTYFCCSHKLGRQMFIGWIFSMIERSMEKITEQMTQRPARTSIACAAIGVMIFAFQKYIVEPILLPLYIKYLVWLVGQVLLRAKNLIGLNLS